MSLVCGKLITPELSPCAGQWTTHTAVVPVPKATINHDHCVVACKNHIRASRQALNVQSVSVSKGKYQPSQQHFRPRVLATDGGHVSATLFRGMYVHYARVS
jgi:hypothetical protein